MVFYLANKYIPIITAGVVFEMLMVGYFSPDVTRESSMYLFIVTI